MNIHGIIPPVATPMLANEDLDIPRLKWFIGRLIKGGVHGIFVLGTNSEFYALDEREKQEVIATAVEHVNGRVPVYADGREGGRAGRVDHHALFRDSESAGDFRSLSPHCRDDFVAGYPLQQP